MSSVNPAMFNRNKPATLGELEMFDDGLIAGQLNINGLSSPLNVGMFLPKGKDAPKRMNLETYDENGNLTVVGKAFANGGQDGKKRRIDLHVSASCGVPIEKDVSFKAWEDEKGKFIVSLP